MTNRVRGLSGEERRLLAIGRVWDEMPPEVVLWMEMGVALLPRLERVCSVCGAPSEAVCAQVGETRGVLTVLFFCEEHRTAHDPEWREREALAN